MSHFWRNFASQRNQTRLDGQTQDEREAVGGALASHSQFGQKARRRNLGLLPFLLFSVCFFVRLFCRHLLFFRFCFSCICESRDQYCNDSNISTVVANLLEQHSPSLGPTQTTLASCCMLLLVAYSFSVAATSS